MIVIKPSVEMLDNIGYWNALRLVERAARTCYGSEDRISENSAEALIRQCIRRGHESVLEHANISILLTTDRGVTHELVRHRVGVAYSQESTRYVRYAGDMKFIEPWWWDNSRLCAEGAEAKDVFYRQCVSSEIAYKQMLEIGLPAQAARAVLPNALATKIVVTANVREWRHILKLRCDPAAHPDMRRIMHMVLDMFASLWPVFFDDIETKQTQGHERD